MARVKKGSVRRKRHKSTLKITKGQYGTRSKLFRRANEAMLHSLWYSYRDRRQRRRDLRRLWISRINAAARANGLTYSKFMKGLKLAGIDINRKMLSEIAIHDAAGFTQIAETAKAKLEAAG